MVKVLEYLPESKVKPVGGPAGYVYNLTKLCNSDDIKISYLPSEEEKNTFRNYGKTTNFLRVINDVRKIKQLYSGSYKDISFNDYDFIHFHSTHDLFSARKQLEGYTGIVLLTSHSPKPLYQEFVFDIYSDIERFFLKKYALKKYEYVDEYAFDNADYIIFPCEYAEEPYLNNWDEYTGIRERNKNKYFYMETGAIQKKPIICVDDIRKMKNIQGRFVISYAGRHLPVKGYNKLKDFGLNLFSKYKDLSVIVCGREEPLKGLEHKDWHEIGWTKDADSYINASDVFILPNEETYFDLILLEVLSMGKIIVASYTGGNKYFEKFEDSGIFLYKTDEEFYEIIDNIYHMSLEKRNFYEEQNMKLYDKYFNEKIFFERYEKLLKELSNG